MTHDDPHAVTALFLAATNEGTLYPTWCAMGRDYMNQPDSAWSDVLRPYAMKLRRQGLQDDTSAATINTAAARLRDYYREHVRETGR